MLTITVTYLIETEVDPAVAAARIANEQSSGIGDNRLDGIHAEVEVLDVEEVLEVAAIADATRTFKATDRRGSETARAVVRLRFTALQDGYGPEELFNLVYGEPHLLGVLSSCRLIDIDWSENRHWPGPALGFAGLRQHLRVGERPLVCAPVKPSMTLPLAEHVDRAVAAARGGADIVKDDELCLDTASNPLLQRIQRVLEGFAAVEASTGHRTLYVANLIGSRRHLGDRLKAALDLGVSAVMVAPGLMGLDVIDEVRESITNHGRQVFVFSHSTFVSAQFRPHRWGVALRPWVGFQRGQGADVVVLPSGGGSFGISLAETADADHAARDEHPIWRAAAPAHSGSLSAANVRIVAEASGGSDFIITAGAGIFDHPDGIEAGAQDLRIAVEGGEVDASWLAHWDVVE